MTGSTLARITACFLLAATTTTWAGNGSWTSNGPDGGTVYEVRFDPNTPTTMYATTRGGFFRSEDGGITWNASNDGLVDVTNNPMVIDAEAPGHLYVFDFGNRLYRSTDYGQSWIPTGFVIPAGHYPWQATDEPGSTGRFFLTLSNGVITPPTSPLLLKTIDSGATFATAGTGLPNARFYGIAIESGSPNRLLAGVEYTDTGSSPVLYRSLDGGTTWSAVGPNASYSYDISFGAGTFPNRTVYASIDGMLHKSVDSGSTWTATTREAMQVLAHPSLSATVFFSDETLSVGPQVSNDSGATATVITSGLTSNPTYTDLSGKAAIVQPFMFNFSPGFPAPGTAIWLSTQGDGLFRSIDGGTTWASSHVGMRASNIRALAVHPNALTIGPGGAGKYLFAGFGDSFYSSPAMFRSVDTGNNWSVLNSGLRASQIRAITFDPTTAGVGSASPPPAINSATIYASGRSSVAGFPTYRYRNAGLYKSTNGGLNWSVIDGGLPRFGVVPNDYSDLGTVRAIAIDLRSCTSPPPSGPCNSGPLQRLLATADGFRNPTVVTVDTSVTPNIKHSRGIYSHKIIVTNNAGSTWAALDTAGNGLPERWTGSACPVSTTGTNPPCTAQPTPERQLASLLPVVISPQNGNTLYVGSYIGTNGLLPTSLDPITGVFKSTDGGATWSQTSTGLPKQLGKTNVVHDVLSMAMHPTNDQVLWATTVDFAVPNSGTIYKTVNGGATWTESGEGLSGNADIRAIAVDASDLSGNTLYASGSGTPANPGAIYKSENGGATWRSISVGLPADAALSLAVDPFNFNVIHAGTNTGVWSLTQVPDADGDGIPDGTENNAPNGGDGNGDNQADAVQRDVGSTVIVIRQPEGAGGFFTSDIQTALSTPSEPGGCQQAVDVQAQPASQFGRDFVAGSTYYFKYPRDVARFEVLNCSRVIVDIKFHNAAFGSEYGWSFRFFGPLSPGDDDSLRWSDFSSRAQRLPGSPATWRLTLDANQFGSYRPLNDSILFVGGPACYDDRLFRDSMENSPDSGPATCDH
ncbi:MAG: hypothetical protein KA505_00445 [Xanthomonadales bacterium]|nr:hypothetical protein [Xanthomonadales bacterium]